MSDRTPSIMFFDVETSPNVVYSWRVGNKISLSDDNIVEERKLICICYKYAGDKKVHHLTWDKNKDDKAMLEVFGQLLTEVDVAIGHNGDRFDLKWIKTRNLIHRLPPITNIHTVDTLKLVRNNFNFNSNKLSYLCDILNVAPKLDVGYSLWTDVMNGDKKALKDMVTYCKQDVESLEQVFNTIRPYVDRMPIHAGVLTHGSKDDCPSCSSLYLHKRGYAYTRAGRYQRFQCQDCGHWFRGTKMVKDDE